MLIKLINGYTIVFITPKKNKTAYVSSIIANGFCNETPDDVGINHVLEHVLFDSWKKCKPHACSQFWVKKPVFINGFTTMTQIKYFADGLSDELPAMLDYIIDITTQPIFLQTHLTAAKKIVVNELNTRINSVDYELNKTLSNELYSIPGFQQATNDLLQKKNVENISLRDLVDYHAKYYTPSNTYFFVSGDYAVSRVLQTFKDRLPAQKMLALPTSAVLKNPFSYASSKLLFVKNRAITGGAVHFSMMCPIDIHINNERIMHLQLTCSIINTDLTTILRVEHKLIYSISVLCDTYYYGTVIEIKGTCSESNLVSILEYITAYLREKKTKYIDNDILENTKKLLLLFRYNHIKNPMEIAEFYESQYMLNYMQKPYFLHNHHHDHIYSETEYDDNVKSVRAAHIRAIIKMIHFNHIIIGYMGKKNLNLTVLGYFNRT